MNLRDPQVQKKAAAVLVPLALAVVYYVMLYTPRVEEADRLEIRAETLESQNNAMRAIVARYGSDLERRLAIFEEHLQQLEQLIPHREDVPHLINQITEGAAGAGVDLTVLRPGGESPGDFYSQQTFELEVTGDYHSVAEYLTAIGSMPRIVRSSHLRLMRVGTGSDSQLRAAFRIQTYVLPAPGESEAQNANG
jgi:type IV pilus assembly protein PilO